MKLRTKITAIAALVILFVSAISDGIIWMICRRALMNEAKQTALREIAVLQSEYSGYVMRAEGFLSEQEILYFLKRRGDDFVICLRGEEVLFNETVLTAEDLSALKTYDMSDSGFLTAQKEQNGHTLLVAQTNATDGITLFRITDLSTVTRRLRQLAIGMLGVLAVVCIPTVLLLRYLLRRTLYPLQTLSDSAKQIAAGAYDERAAVSGEDEVGMLAADFNKMADAVQEKIASLADSEQRKTMFMADFSHELKTPLTAISGYAQTLRTVKLSDEDRAEALGYIYSESRRLDRLSKKMMRLMQLDSTESLHMEPIDNKRLLEAVAATCQPISEKKGVAVQIGDCSGKVSGDFDLLHDALCNLVDNAVKASSSGQTVTLSAANDLLTVADMGCGIPPEEIKNLTEPFYMVDKSRSRKSGGAGLGLSLVAQINRLHGIEMKIESTIGQGTQIHLRFSE